jgi:predicted ATPase
MFLRRIELTNVRSIDHLVLSFDQDGGGIRKWTLLLGENGCGKTSLLKSIALVTAGSQSLPELLARPDTWIRLGEKTCTIKADLVTARGEERQIALEWSREENIREIFGRNAEAMDRIDAALRHSYRNYFVIGYGATRRLGGNRSSGIARELFTQVRAQCVATLFSNDAVLNPVDTWAMDLDYRKSKVGLQAVRAALKDLLPGVTLARIDRKNRELLFDTQDGCLPLDQLSEGYQNMSAWCGDLLYRITEVYKDYRNPLSARGLLLIDEIDLHLHPIWQRALKDFLDQKLPHFQILATTHSPLTAQQAGEGELFFLKRVEVNGPARIEQYPGAPNTLMTHQLIMSPAFGLHTVDSKKVEEMKTEYRSLKERQSKTNGKKAGGEGKPMGEVEALSAHEESRLGSLKEELSDLPDWSIPSELEVRKTRLLEKIAQSREGDGRTAAEGKRKATRRRKDPK